MAQSLTQMLTSFSPLANKFAVTILAVTGLNAAAQAQTSPVPTRVVVYKSTTDAIGNKVELKMSIFEPTGHKSTDKTPAIAVFFGGGWVNGDTKLFFPHCAYFASRGMVAVAPDYRVKSRQQTTPFESVADGKSAIRYLRAHAAELGIDPTHVAAAGSSAGGHVAAAAGILPDSLDEKSEDHTISSVPNALVLFNPVTDTSPEGYGNALIGARWKEISPLQSVRPGLPPTIIFHGTADKTVRYANAVAFEAAMKAAGNRVELVTFQGAGHSVALHLEQKNAIEAMRDADMFLTSLGYMTGEPTLAAPEK